jgi:hypothetical protein
MDKRNLPEQSAGSAANKAGIIDLTTMTACLDRAYRVGVAYSLPTIDRMTLAMRMLQMREGIDFTALLCSADDTFVHDVYGINRHTKADRPDFTECWRPRCAGNGLREVM